MVDIHIRDISDKQKRHELIRELVAKNGPRNLVFEVVPPHFYTGSGGGGSFRLRLHGNYRQQVNYLGKGYSGPFAPHGDEILVSVTSYEVEKYSRYGQPIHGGYEPTGEENWYVQRIEAGGGRAWDVVVPTMDLINIYAQVSVDPVVVKKEIEA